MPLLAGCWDTTPKSHSIVAQGSDVSQLVLDYKVHWPPLDPADEKYSEKSPLLIGTVNATADAELLKIQVELTRPADGESRKRWNRRLAFPQYDWMSRVRVWDSQEAWLWPNLPYLLRAYGEERVERYGGIDPGKGVDNDFAAVVIRQATDKGTFEKSSLVSAEWSAPDSETYSKISIVHTARSEQFEISFDSKQDHGKFGVWLIYADFLTSDPPRNWPEEPEFAGGILMWCSIDWKRTGDQIELTASTIAPPVSSGVDWEQWNVSARPRRLKW